VAQLGDEAGTERRGCPGRKIYILNEKDIDFQPSTNFKLLSQKRKKINKRDFFFKFIISVRGGQKP
jgi:hypothetical protein